LKEQKGRRRSYVLIEIEGVSQRLSQFTHLRGSWLLVFLESLERPHLAQPTRAKPVPALFVFPDLLKSDIKLFSERGPR
jgi:hypothetical protein